MSVNEAGAESPQQPEAGKKIPSGTRFPYLQLLVFVGLFGVFWLLFYNRLLPDIGVGVLALMDAYQSPIWSSGVISLFLVSAIFLVARAGLGFEIGPVKFTGDHGSLNVRLPRIFLYSSFIVSLILLIFLPKDCQPPSFKFQVTTLGDLIVAPQSILEFDPAVNMVKVEVISNLPQDRLVCSMMVAGDSVDQMRTDQCQVDIPFNGASGTSVLLAEVHKQNCSNEAIYNLFFRLK